MNATVLIEGRPPIGFWAQRLDWDIDTVDSSVLARTEARSAVAAAGESHHAAHPSGHVFAAASERVAMTMGELTTNGLRHAEPPVTASLSRGNRGWLLVVSDGSVSRVPAAPGQDITAVGGLGLRLVMSMSLEVGWCLERGRKLVWALIGDTPPKSMLATLDRAAIS
ncbi:ATP-binding protein [Kineosporia babensis]|uniref:ATP-binding protein n=1 Tax=Kineosporia babensis TaxID=499548 RepID=A0A9X1NF53_9ACTN|nr:ATP-binding protein [Kineosporia babensis]MCD5312171.1 ATP-binding protein [Kineosporia babensis]